MILLIGVNSIEMEKNWIFRERNSLFGQSPKLLMRLAWSDWTDSTILSEQRRGVQGNMGRATRPLIGQNSFLWSARDVMRFRTFVGFTESSMFIYNNSNNNNNFLYWHFENFIVYISESPISLKYQQYNKVYIRRILDAINITVKVR